MKLIQNNFSTVWRCFVSVSFQCVYTFNVYSIPLRSRAIFSRW